MESTSASGIAPSIPIRPSSKKSPNPIRQSSIIELMNRQRRSPISRPRILPSITRAPPRTLQTVLRYNTDLPTTIRSNGEIDLREDHPIFHEAFYTNHVNSITRANKRLSRLSNYIGRVHPVRIHSQNVLKKVYEEISARADDPIGSNMGRFIKKWEDTIRAAGFGFKEHECEDREKFNELIAIKRVIEAISQVQKHKLEVVLNNLPNFSWKTGAPLRRMLELGNQVSRHESLLAHARANIAAIISADRQISNLLNDCNKVLLAVINILLETYKGTSRPQLHNEPNTNEGVIVYSAPYETIPRKSTDKTNSQVRQAIGGG